MIKIDKECKGCNTILKLQVCHNNIGYFLGFFCPFCGLQSTESEYFKSRIKTEMELYQIEQCYNENIRHSEELIYNYKWK